jgi:cell division protein FtsB
MVYWKPMTTQFLNTITDGVDLANYFVKEITSDTDYNTKKKEIKYLHQTVSALKEQINDYRNQSQPEPDTPKCKC